MAILKHIKNLGDFATNWWLNRSEFGDAYYTWKDKDSTTKEKIYDTTRIVEQMFTPKSYGAYGAVKSLKKLKKPNMNKASLGFQPDDLGDGMLLDNNAEEKYRARRRAKVDAQIEFDKDAPFRRRLEETLATGKDPKKRNYSYQEMVAHPFRTADKVMKKDEKFRSDRENEKKYGY